MDHLPAPTAAAGPKESNVSDGSSNMTEVFVQDQPQWALVALSLIPLWILTGNLLVLLSVCGQRNLRTLSNWVIASLAFTDFLLAITVVPLGTYQVVSGRWDLGLTMCLLWTGSDVFLSTTSILHLTAIAIHRYHGIANPLRMRSAQDTRHVLLLVIPAWSISFAISLPLIIQGNMDSQHVLIGSEETGYSCGIFDRTFAIYSSLVSFFIPLAIMVFADIRSIQILRKNIKFPLKTRAFKTKSKESARSADSRESCLYEYTTCAANDECAEPLKKAESSSLCAKKENTNSCSSSSRLNIVTNSPNIELKNCSTNTSEQELVHVSPRISPKTTRKINPNYKGRGRSKSMVYISMLAARGAVKLNSRERRAERALIWVFVCFVVCWLPFFITNLTYGVCRTCDIPSDVFLTFTWLGYLSSGVNPCIYTLLNKDFRSAFVSLLTCGLKQPKQNRFNVALATAPS